jgi:hypothetical protein
LWFLPGISAILFIADEARETHCGLPDMQRAEHSGQRLLLGVTRKIIVILKLTKKPSEPRCPLIGLSLTDLNLMSQDLAQITLKFYEPLLNSKMSTFYTTLLEGSYTGKSH